MKTNDSHAGSVPAHAWHRPVHAQDACAEMEIRMAFALIFAGGVGTRMDSKDVPKQFLKVDGIPIIIRTISHFEKHEQVDGIVVVCVEPWIGELQHELEEYGIRKVVKVLPGGRTGFQSIHTGLEYLKDILTEEDVVLICDGVRPCLSPGLIGECIRNAGLYGSAVPVTPSIDSVLYSDDGKLCGRNISRKKIYITQAPQGYLMREIIRAHGEAIEKGMESVSSADLMIELGREVHLFQGIRENIKVTTVEDLNALRATQYYEHFKDFANEELNIK